MNDRSPAATIGSGAKEFLASHLEAKVVGIFRHGFYVGRGAEVVAVVGPSISSGPLNIRLRDEPVLPGEGAPVAIAPTLEVEHLRIEIATAEYFSPTVPPGVCRANLLNEIDVPIPADLRPVWPKVTLCVEAGDLAGARDLLCGRGQGLTPEGDDVLAGILLVASGEESIRSTLSNLVAEAKTTDLSLAFLTWAAKGECVAETHDLLWAADQGDRSAFELARRQVARLGGSTGPAMLAGIALAGSLGAA